MNKPNLNKIIEANKDKTSHIPKKTKHSLPKQNSFTNSFDGEASYKMGGGYFPPYHSYTPPRMNNGGGLLSRKVTCSSCGWSWKAVDGGKDVMTCHHCGGMIKMQNGGLTKYQSLGEVNEQPKDLPGVTIQAGKKTEQQKIEDAKAQQMDYQMGWYNSPMYKKIMSEQISPGEEWMMDERQKRLDALDNVPLIPYKNYTELGRLNSRDAFKQGKDRILLNVGAHDDYHVGNSQTLGQTIGHEWNHFINNRGQLIPQKMADFIDGLRVTDPNARKEYKGYPSFKNTPFYEKEILPYAKYNKFASTLAGQPIISNIAEVDEILKKRNETENWKAIPEYDSKKAPRTFQNLQFFNNFYNQPGNPGYTEYAALVNKVRQDAAELGLYNPFTEEFTQDTYDKFVKLGNTDKTRDFRQLVNWNGENEVGQKKTIKTFNTVAKNENKQSSNMVRYGGELEQYQVAGQVRKNPPIYVNDLNDPRLVAFDDSTHAFNAGEDMYKFGRSIYDLVRSPINNEFRKNYNFVRDRNNKPVPYPGRIRPIYPRETYVEHYNRKPGSFYERNIYDSRPDYFLGNNGEHWGDVGTGWQRFNEPSQPVIYKPKTTSNQLVQTLKPKVKPKAKPEPTLKSRPFVPATKIPMGQPGAGMQIQQRTFPKLDIPNVNMSGPYMVGYQDWETGQGVDRGFATAEERDAFYKQLGERDANANVNLNSNISSYYDINKRNKKQGGEMITDPMGQWKYPGMNTRIPGNNITMQGVPYPVLAKANNGMTTMMYPGQEYNFPGASYVDEYPRKRMQNGGIPKAQVGEEVRCGPNQVYLEGTGCIDIRSRMYKELYESGKLVQQNPDESVVFPTMKPFVVNSKLTEDQKRALLRRDMQETSAQNQTQISSADQPWYQRAFDIATHPGTAIRAYNETGYVPSNLGAASDNMGGPSSIINSFSPATWGKAAYNAGRQFGSAPVQTTQDLIQGTGNLGYNTFNGNLGFNLQNGLTFNQKGANPFGDAGTNQRALEFTGNVLEASPLLSFAGLRAGKVIKPSISGAIEESSSAMPKVSKYTNFAERNKRVIEAYANRQKTKAGIPTSAEEYRKFLNQQRVQQQAGDIIRSQGQPDPSIGGWSPTNNPETNRMIGLAQHGKPQKLTNLDFLTSEQLINEKIFTNEFDKQIIWFKSMGYDAEVAAEKAANRTLEILKDNPDFDYNLGIDKTLERLSRGSNTNNSFMQSQKPLTNQAKSVMRANPSGIMDANFSISDPNIKVFGDRMPGFKGDIINGLEDVLKMVKDPEDILKLKQRIAELYKKMPNTIPEGTPYTGTKGFNSITPNKFGGSIERFKTGGLKGSANNNFRNEPCPEGQVRVNGQCMLIADAEALRQRQYQNNPNTSWEETSPGEYRSVTQMTPVTVASKPKYGTVTQNLGNGISFDYTANLKNQTPVSKTWDFTLPAKGQLNAQNAKWKSYLPGIYNQPGYTPFGNTTRVNGINVPIGEQATIGPGKSASQFLTPREKERLNYLESWYGKPTQPSDWDRILKAYDMHTDSKEVNDAATGLRNQYYNNVILNPNSARNQANDIAMNTGKAGVLTGLTALGLTPTVSAALNAPLLGTFGTSSGLGALTAGNLLNAGFMYKGIKSVPETSQSWNELINNPTSGNLGNATEKTLETALDMFPFLHSAYAANPNMGKNLKEFIVGNNSVPLSDIDLPKPKLNGIDFSSMKFNPIKGAKKLWNKILAETTPFADEVMDKIHDGIPLTNEELFFYEKTIKNDPGIELQWRADRLSNNKPTEAFLEMPKNPDGTYYKGPTTSQSTETISRKNKGIFTNEATVEADGKTYIVDKNNPSKVVVVEGEDFYFVDETDPVYSIIQETHNPSYKKPVTTQQPQQQTVATVAEETKPVTTTAQETPAATTTTSTQTNKTVEELTLEERLNRARTQSDPNPGPSPTERNTGANTGAKTETPTQTPTTKKPISMPGWGKKTLKGAGILGGLSLGIYGVSKLVNSNTPPTKPFTNAPNTNNKVATSDTMFYTPAVDSSYLNALDTNYVNPLDTNYVNPDTGQVAPLTPDEIREALDTAGVPRRRFGGQQQMSRFQNGGMISIERLQNALNNIKI